MRVFLDANILFSAAQEHSRMRALLDVLLAHGECVTNAYAEEEARRNLELKWPENLPNLSALIRKCEFVPGLAVETTVELKPKDRPILGGAIAGRATHLLTGDKTDFGHLFGKSVEGVKVVSPQLLADELIKLGWI